MNTRDPKNEKLAKLLSQLSVESPDKEFDERFWRRFEVEKDLPLKGAGMSLPAWAGHLLISTCAAVAAIGILAAGAVKDQPSIRLVQGEASISRGAGSASPVKGRELLKTGDRLRTGPSAWTILELENGYRVKIQPESEVAVGDLKSKLLPGKTVFYLSKGQTLVSIGDQIPRKYPLEIRTPNAFARAMGTQFIVTAPSNLLKGSEVSVVRGVVHVGSIVKNRPIGSSSIDVPAGEAARVSEGMAILKPEAIVAAKRAELEELFQFSRKNQVILLLSMSPERLEELLAPCVVYIRFESKSPIASKLAGIAQSIRKASDETNVSKHLEAARSLEKAVQGQTEIDEVPILLFVGAYYHYLGNDEEAARVFAETAENHPHSSFRSLSILAAAKLYAEKLGEPLKAAKLARLILSEYPESYEVSKARAILRLIDSSL